MILAAMEFTTYDLLENLLDAPQVFTIPHSTFTIYP